MADLFEPMSEEEFYREVDKGIEQADNGQLQDAHEAMDEITRELEAGYTSEHQSSGISAFRNGLHSRPSTRKAFEPSQRLP